MSTINGLPATAAAMPVNDMQSPAAPRTPVTAAGLKVCYGDPAHAEGLQNMLQKLGTLKSAAQSIVSGRNPCLQ